MIKQMIATQIGLFPEPAYFRVFQHHRTTTVTPRGQEQTRRGDSTHYKRHDALLLASHADATQKLEGRAWAVAYWVF